MARLSFRCSDELVAGVDAARGDVARERWLRRAVEAALVDPAERWKRAEVEVEERYGLKPPTPAEQPEDFEIGEPDNPGGIDYERFTGLGKPFREFRPYPKGGKR